MSDLDDGQRGVFRDALGADDGLWARGRAWALWKGLISVGGEQQWDAWGRHMLDELGYAIE